MTQLKNVNIALYNFKAETYLNNEVINIDSENTIVSIVSKPTEIIIPIYKINDISLAKEQLTTQIIN